MDVSIYQSIVNTASFAYQDRNGSAAGTLRNTLAVQESDVSALLQPVSVTGPSLVPFGTLEDSLLDPLPSLAPSLATAGTLEATLLQSLPFAEPALATFGTLGTRLNTFA